MGPEQSRPKHFNDALNSPFELKRELPSFLMKEWQRQHFSGIIGNRDATSTLDIFTNVFTSLLKMEY